jgi:tRNA-binding protein
MEPALPANLAWEDFRKVDLRVGRIVDVAETTARKPSYRLSIDFGPLGTRVSSAAIRPWYTPEELVGRRVVCVVNFPPRQVGPVRSEVLTTGSVGSDGRVVLLSVGEEAELGSRVA